MLLHLVFLNGMIILYNASFLLSQGQELSFHAWNGNFQNDHNTILLCIYEKVAGFGQFFPKNGSKRTEFKGPVI